MKKTSFVIAAVAMAMAASVLAVSCGNGKGNSSSSQSGSEITGNTDGEKLVSLFNSEAASGSIDLEKTASLLSEKILSDYSCMSAPVEEGFLEGFDASVSGFSKGYCFRPMIGSIPLMGYVFESEDPQALETYLKKFANTRWNICTEAKETVSSVKGKYVLFAMLPGDEEF